ncbi:MAG TPA: serine hydrolase domain-containing protein [Blastocatellia bacterium]|jgi:CubicO group peptidase (beta-lactamase class C family)|nr:serine hydrolase domain-containing protein [Blastocatellia bacterium]
MKDGGKSLVCASAFPLSLKARIEDGGGKLKTGVPAKELIGDLSGFIPGLMKKHNVPGLSIAIIRDASILWSQGFGVKGKSSGEPVSASTVFEAASLSKPAFAYAALRMCETGKLGLDTPLTEYRREPLIANEPRLKLITARMVLSHSSGLPHGRAPGTPIGLRFEPGTQFAYSATGFQYLQMVVERLSGQPLAEFMKAGVLEPFGMRESSFGWIDRYRKEAAEGHDRDGNPGLSGNGRYLNYSPEERAQERRNYPEYSYPSSSAGLYTTAADYARFVSEIIEPSAKDRFHLSDEMTAEMLRPQVKVSDAISWGLGWGIERGDAGDAFWHWGDWGVFRNFAIAFKKQKIGVVVLTNSFNGPKAYREIVPRAIGGSHPAFSWVNGYRP